MNKSEYFFQPLRRAHLIGDALELLRRRVLVIPLPAWLPLLVLSALGGQALGGSVSPGDGDPARVSEGCTVEEKGTFMSGQVVVAPFGLHELKERER